VIITGMISVDVSAEQRGLTMASKTTSKNEPVKETSEVNTNGEIIVAPSKFSKEELNAAQSFKDFMELATAVHGGVVAAHETELGDGFRVASEDDKSKLIGVPLLFMEWSFNSGDYSDFVSARVISQGDGTIGKWVINDGGTGIYAELKGYTEKTGKFGGLFCRNGLRVSRYTIDSETGQALNKRQVGEYAVAGKKTAPAATFYLDTSA
jgi:hypothetical protein